MHTGCPMHRVIRIPHQKQPAAGNYRLSKEAQQGLKSSIGIDLNQHILVRIKKRTQYLPADISASGAHILTGGGHGTGKAAFMPLKIRTVGRTINGRRGMT